MDEENRITPYPLRMEPELRMKLQAKADKSNIPLSQEITDTLKGSARKPATLDIIEDRLNKIDARQAVIESQQSEILAILNRLI